MMKVTIHQPKPVVESLEKLLRSVTDEIVREKARDELYAEIRETEFKYAWGFCRTFPFFGCLEVPPVERDKAADRFFQKHKTIKDVLDNVNTHYSWCWGGYLRRAEIKWMGGERDDVVKLKKRIKTLDKAMYLSSDYSVHETLEMSETEVKILIMATTNR